MSEYDVFFKLEPSHQNAIDIFKGGWKTSFPGHVGLNAGDKNFFDNGIVRRIKNCLPGGLRDKNVVEIGPFEGHYTWQLEKEGVASVVAIEVNAESFLKCLVVKEIMGLEAKFLLGDFMRIEPKKLSMYDFCMAAGVLYHQIEPLKMLDRITLSADSFYIWTHYYDDFIAGDPGSYPHFNSDCNKVISYKDFECSHYYRSYQWKRESMPPKGFSGGPQGYAYWLRREDIFEFLESRGFRVKKIITESKEHSAGPCIGFVAQKE